MFFILGLSGCVGNQVTEYFDGSYLVSEQTILNIFNINGKVEISGWDGNNVTVNAVKKTSYGKEELDKIEINVTSIGNYLNIETQYTGLSSMKGGVDMNIKVPKTIHIESVTTSNGAIQLSDCKGNVSTSSTNGAININDIDGYVSAETTNAHIEVKGTSGVKDIHTSNGVINVEIADFLDDVSIDTSNAGITISLNPSLNATIEMRTSNSKITVEGISLFADLIEETHVIGSLGSGIHKLDIRTSNSYIHLINLEL